MSKWLEMTKEWTVTVTGGEGLICYMSVEWTSRKRLRRDHLWDILSMDQVGLSDCLNGLGKSMWLSNGNIWKSCKKSKIATSKDQGEAESRANIRSCLLALVDLTLNSTRIVREAVSYTQRNQWKVLFGIGTNIVSKSRSKFGLFLLWMQTGPKL